MSDSRTDARRDSWQDEPDDLGADSSVRADCPDECDQTPLWLHNVHLIIVFLLIIVIGFEVHGKLSDLQRRVGQLEEQVKRR